MDFFKATVLSGALLFTGAAIAQQPDTSLSTTPTPQSAPAQPGSNHAPNPNKQTKRLAKQLGLSRDQIAEIRPILTDRDQQIQELRADSALAPKDRRARVRAIAQDSQAKIEGVLSDSQKQQFEQALSERRNRNKQTIQAAPQS